jgi:membrane-associated phospholipid phosphatase
MKGFFYKILRNIAGCFRGKFLLWHAAAIVITFLIVISGIDWQWFLFSRGSAVETFLFPAVILGGLVPLIFPLALFGVSLARKKMRTLNIAYALGQAALLGLLISDLYKFFTGRAHPSESLANKMLADNSHIFQFGFFRGGVFWGWPSTHTTIAFAMAVALVKLYPENKVIKYLAIAYAFYVGIGVSTNIHWFSDFAAGAIVGSVIGITVGKSYWERYCLGNK